MATQSISALLSLALMPGLNLSYMSSKFICSSFIYFSVGLSWVIFFQDCNLCWSWFKPCSSLFVASGGGIGRNSCIVICCCICSAFRCLTACCCRNWNWAIIIIRKIVQLWLVFMVLFYFGEMSSLYSVWARNTVLCFNRFRKELTQSTLWLAWYKFHVLNSK